ncbi:MAG: MmcQ/YjbR family DNA-binding protein [Crocinitomicaceae bacterium]|nr:MmcQ/YjbR family DNA-binding protein [Crocinitomicaceae bacterium]
MNIEEYRTYCLSKNATTESFPFDETTLVFKVAGKMFALTKVDLFETVNLKCDPERSIELRETFNGVNAGFHMNKKHWNTVTINSDVSRELLLELIDHSYDLVVKSLTKKVRDEYAIG